MEREPRRFFTRPIFGGFLALSLTFGVPRSLLQNRTKGLLRRLEDNMNLPPLRRHYTVNVRSRGKQFCFPVSRDVSRDEVEGNISTLGKTKLTVSLGI